MNCTKSKDNVLERQIKELKKSRAGYVSYLTSIINSANKLMGDYSNKEQLEILLPKFKEIVHKIYVVDRDYCSLLPEENVEGEVKFFQMQKFRSIHMQTSIKRFLVQCKHNTRYSKLSVCSKQSSKKSNSSQHTRHKTKLSSKPSSKTHSSGSTTASVKSSIENERAFLLATQAEEIYNQKLKKIEKEKGLLELENEKEKDLDKLIEGRQKVELTKFDFELENKSVTSYDSQSQHYFEGESYQKPLVRFSSQSQII